MIPEKILKRPIILTEKSSRLRDLNQVIFEVAREANKIQIRDAIQKMFKVTVTDVNTMLYRGKDRRMGRGYAKFQNWKKAVITLKAGDTIQFFDEEASEAPVEATASGESSEQAGSAG
jgi:large subunit ribosomal protein L23